MKNFRFVLFELFNIALPFCYERNFRVGESASLEIENNFNMFLLKTTADDDFWDCSVDVVVEVRNLAKLNKMKKSRAHDDMIKAWHLDMSQIFIKIPLEKQFFNPHNTNESPIFNKTVRNGHKALHF